jgi:hypothetical protein
MNATPSHNGWESLRHTGLLLAPKQVQELETRFRAPAPSDFALAKLRREIIRLTADPSNAGDFVAWVLVHVFGFPDDPLVGTWKRAANVPAEFSHTLLSGEPLKPRHVWIGPRKGVLPVFVDKNPRLGQGRSRKAVSDVVQWLRLARQPLALVTNTRQWRIVFAGLDFDASCESELDLWLEEGGAGLQLQALCQLLQPVLWDLPRDGDVSPLAAAIRASRKGQAEVSAILGERVREAVEALVLAHGDALLQAGLDRKHGADIYRAAVRVVMRMVVALFAESRDLLPRTNPFYYENYSLQGLFEQLQRLAVRGRGRLSNRHAAWPRVLALFRLIYDGSHHEAMAIRDYGGELFQPASAEPVDTVEMALRVFETACFDSQGIAVPDEVIHRMLEFLTRTRVRIRQGRSTISTLMPVDFGDLSSEYIGILYEGLLDYELRTAPADDSIVFLAVGNEPSLPLKRLEAMDDAQIREVIKELGDTKGEGDGGEEAGEEPAPDEAAPDSSDESDSSDDPAETVDATSVAGPAEAARARALAWTQRACLAASLVRKPKGALTPEKRMLFDRAVQATALRLLRRVVLPSAWYLVRWGGTRKGAGTFYTRPQLAIPLVQRTLRPLAYDPPNGDTNAPSQEWTPKKPEAILALKVADIAGGSGSFPVANLRFLTDALYQSLYTHNRIQGDGWRRPLSVLLGLKDADTTDAERLPAPPDAGDFEPRTKAILRRYVVERCIYAVDLDPLAVELCRLSLWIETMDRDLPFSFLDHKVKCGNSLVGCWFDHFRHYPALAWKREGGDKTHTNGVHFQKETRTKALKEFVDERLKPDLERFITGQGDLFAGAAPQEVSAAHDAALAELRAIHDLPIHDTPERARLFQELEHRPGWLELKAAFDRWCACWFWPADKLAVAPLPTTFASPPAPTDKLAADIARRMRFFHWELQFPDVFDRPNAGFDAVTGNPPWEIAKPSSTEFFSNLDPLYRTYGKQDALRRQTELFDDVTVEREWLDYCAGFKEMSNFVGCAAFPFGDPACEAQGGEKFSIARGKFNATLHEKWRTRRTERTGYADTHHPFRHQGSADLNLYKLFLEQAHALLKPSGRLGYLVPSGLYSDHGSGGLRTLFLDQCQWEWLFGFENRDGIFSIHRSFKFNPVIIQKGGRTAAISTAFMRRNVDDWAEAERFVTPYTRERVTRFSPKSKAILEIQSARDLEILENIYANSVLLGDESPDGWGIKYACEFHMTNDSKLFPPRPKWEAEGYQPDEYSRWLKGNWRPIAELWRELQVAPLTDGERRCAQLPYDTLPIPRADIPAGTILNREATQFIAESDIADVALPLYEGRMIGQFDFSQKGWVSGKGRSAVWRDIPWERKQIEPQYLMGRNSYLANSPCPWLPKLSHMRVGSSTNERSATGCAVTGVPTGDTAATFWKSTWRFAPAMAGLFNSFIFDFITRSRLVGLHLDYHVFAQNPLPRNWAPEKGQNADLDLGLNSACIALSTTWIGCAIDAQRSRNWKRLWAVSCAERLRLRSISDSLVAMQYGLNEEEMRRILVACDLPKGKANPNSCDPKGFWRVDKEKDPELRHTVLTLVAFHDLQAKIATCDGDRDKGIEAFLDQNDGEGWMLPETLRLADYGLGHDDRARQPQPVASRLGPRFYDWQLAQSPEESWRECHLHARNLLGEAGYQALLAEIAGGAGPAAGNPHPDAVHEPTVQYYATSTPKQGDLF